MTTSQTIAPEDRPTIETVRIFDAPRSLVFDAFAHEEHITQWWGPNGFTNRDSKWDFREGGSWTFVMHHDKYGDFANVISFTEIVKDELIAFNLGDPENPQQFTTSITFADEGEKCRLVFTMTFPNMAVRDKKIKDVGAIQGQKETFDKLEAYLAKG